MVLHRGTLNILFWDPPAAFQASLCVPLKLNRHTQTALLVPRSRLTAFALQQDPMAPAAAARVPVRRLQLGTAANF